MRRALIVALLVAMAAPASANLCVGVRITTEGTANADITVDSTAGGVSVLAANASRCAAMIQNTGAADMRCAPTSITVTATKGVQVSAGEELVLGTESRQAWKCIREDGSNTTAAVVEVP